MYQLIIAADLFECEEKSLLLDWGAGANEFKKLRGAAPFSQYEVVFFGHLGRWQQITWAVLVRLRKARLQHQ